MSKQDKVKIHKEPWYTELEDRLSSFRANKARVNVLKIQLMKDCSPDAKYIATYGETTGKSSESDIDPKEVELIEKEKEVRQIEEALKGLKKDDSRTLIEYRYFKGCSDLEITYLLRIARSSYYSLKNETMIELAQILEGQTNFGHFSDTFRTHKAI